VCISSVYVKCITMHGAKSIKTSNFKIYFNIILPSIPRSSKWFPSVFSIKKRMNLLYHGLILWTCLVTIHNSRVIQSVSSQISAEHSRLTYSHFIQQVSQTLTVLHTISRHTYTYIYIQRHQYGSVTTF